MKYHLEKAINVITRIENEHLDYNAQMRRLEDVAARFAPLMHRLDTNLPSIQQELGLPMINTQLGGGNHESKGESFDQSANRKETLALKNIAEEKKNHYQEQDEHFGEELDEKMVPRVEFLDDIPEDVAGRSLEQQSEKQSDDKGAVGEGKAGEGGLPKEGRKDGGPQESHVCGVS